MANLFQDLAQKVRERFNQAAYDFGVPKNINDNLRPGSTLYNVGTGLQKLNQGIYNAPVIGTIAQVPQKYGTQAGNMLYGGAKQFIEDTPSTIPFTNTKISGHVAGPVKAGLGLLNLTPAGVIGSYAMDSAEGAAAPVFGKDSIATSGIGLMAGILAPGGEGQDVKNAARFAQKVEQEAPEAANVVKRIAGLNLTRLGLSQRGEQVVESIAEDLGKIKGKTVTHLEVVKDAQKAKVLERIIPRAETVVNEASMLKSRVKMTTLDQQIENILNQGGKPETLIKQLIEESKKVSSTASDWGRKLESLKIDPGDVSLRQTVLTDLAKVVDNSDLLAKEAARVDWNDSRSVTQFYRQFVKPKTSEIITEMRYNNMLSNPKSQLRNVMGNFIQTAFLRPSVKVLSGDPLGAAQYYKGAVQAVPLAFNEFTDALRGKVSIESLDLDRIQTGKLPGAWQIPTRLSEGFDRFFQTIIKEGELTAGKTAGEAEDIAKYTLFRNAFDATNKSGQGHLLSMVDNYMNAVDNLRNKPGGRWLVPFLKTPVQIAKQGIEYSPAGVLTLPGTSGVRQKEQIAKMIIGSGISLFGFQKASQGDLTWAAPSDPTANKLFYASGKKPYSFKMGSVWVPMNYLGPLATPMAISAAWNYYHNEAPNALTDGELEKVGKSLLGVTRVWASQTPLENVQQMMEVLMKENPNANMGDTLAFMASSAIPFSGLLRYVAQITDPVYRKSAGFVPGFRAGIPGLSQQNQAYTTPAGTIESREPINSILPYDVGIERQGTLPYNQMLQNRMGVLQTNAQRNQTEKRIKEDGGSVSGDELFNYMKLGEVVGMPEETGYEKLKKQKAIFDKADEVLKNKDLDQSQKESLIAQLGVDDDTVEHWQVAKGETDEKVAYLLDKIQSMDLAERTQFLLSERKPINGNSVATDTVINQLYMRGEITKKQKEFLERNEIVGGELKYIAPSGGGHSVSIPKFEIKGSSSEGRRISIRKAPTIDFLGR